MFASSQLSFRTPEHVDPVERPPQGQHLAWLTLWGPRHRVHVCRSKRFSILRYDFCMAWWRKSCNQKEEPYNEKKRIVTKGMETKNYNENRIVRKVEL